jgi:hypothetical protein
MKFSQIYNEAAKQYLTEQDMAPAPEESMLSGEEQPVVSDEMETALPNEETIDLDEEKYKSLLFLIQKALLMAFSDDETKRNEIANLNQKINKSPKDAESDLINIMDQSPTNFPKSSEI